MNEVIIWTPYKGKCQTLWNNTYRFNILGLPCLFLLGYMNNTYSTDIILALALNIVVPHVAKEN
jgi:hypothetical protein